MRQFSYRQNKHGLHLCIRTYAISLARKVIYYCEIKFDGVSSCHAHFVVRHELIELRFYVPLHTKLVILETFFTANLLA